MTYVNSAADSLLCISRCKIIGIVYSARLSTVGEAELYTPANYYTGQTRRSLSLFICTKFELCKALRSSGVVLPSAFATCSVVFVSESPVPQPPLQTPPTLICS